MKKQIVDSAGLFTSSSCPTSVFQALYTVQERRFAKDGAEKLSLNPSFCSALQIHAAALSPQSSAGVGVVLNLK